VKALVERGRELIAAGGRVSGWSTEDGSLVWTTPVDGWQASEGKSSSLQLQCTSLRARRGVVRVREAGRRSARIRVQTGEVL